MIKDLVIKQLRTHSDERGFFREILRGSSNSIANRIGQVSHSEVNPGVVKAWHGHKYQYQWTYVLKGNLKVAVVDLRSNSPTENKIVEFECGESSKNLIYGFPPGIFHGYQNYSEKAQIIYITSGTYDLNDELRIPADTNKIKFLW